MEKGRISIEEFNNLISSNKIVFVDFFADWCGPCQMMLPVITEIAEDYKDSDKVKILKIDVDENPEIASRYGVMSIPTFLLIKNNEVLETVTGAVSKDLIVSKIEEFSKK